MNGRTMLLNRYYTAQELSFKLPYPTLMRLSMSRPTTPNTGRGGAMWGFALVVFTMPQGWGSDWHANPLHTPT